MTRISVFVFFTIIVSAIGTIPKKVIPDNSAQIKSLSSGGSSFYETEGPEANLSDNTCSSMGLEKTNYTLAFIKTWKTHNCGLSSYTSITIPTIDTEYLYDVDWKKDDRIPRLSLIWTKIRK